MKIFLFIAMILLIIVLMIYDPVFGWMFVAFSMLFSHLYRSFRLENKKNQLPMEKNNKNERELLDE